MRGYGYCPIHEWEREECDHECDLAKRQLARLTSDFCQFWRDRRRGVPPLHHVVRTPAVSVCACGARKDQRAVRCRLCYYRSASHSGVRAA